MPISIAAQRRPKTKSQHAYRLIKESLLNGMFKPGERLVEAKICESLGIQRGPVREALLLLHGEGFVRNQGPYKGHVVEFTEDIPLEQLLFRYELREQVAGGAARLAAKNMNGWQIDSLKELAQRLDDCKQGADREIGYEANIAFHLFLIENCGNPLLREIWETYHLMPPRPRSPDLEDQILDQVHNPHHPSIMDVAEAIALHDQAEAESRMKTRVGKCPDDLCSTPFGIYDCDTAAVLDGVYACGRVLNAFRHLRL